MVRPGPGHEGRDVDNAATEPLTTSLRLPDMPKSSYTSECLGQMSHSNGHYRLNDPKNSAFDCTNCWLGRRDWGDCRADPVAC